MRAGATAMARLAKLLATGFGVGYLPKAPGTAGSMLGFLLGLWLPLPGPTLSSLVIVLVVLGFGAAICTSAERALKRHDPSCIVLDEIIGMWLVLAVASPFRFWMVADIRDAHAPIEVAVLALDLALAFGLFRAFDIFKPAPLKRLARAPEGWGILLDDLGASVYTLLALAAFRLMVVALNGSSAWSLIHA